MNYVYTYKDIFKVKIVKWAEGRGTGVVVVYVEIARASEIEIEATMLGEGGQHVVQEADAGLHIGHARAVERQTHLDLGLPRLSRHLCLPLFHLSCNYIFLVLFLFMV